MSKTPASATPRYGATKAAKDSAAARVAAQAAKVSASAEQIAQQATAAQAVDAVNPQQAADQDAGIQIQIDPQRLAQAVQMKNARLIASMVHENAALEVALEQERGARLEAEAKVEALQQMLAGDDE